MRWIVLAMMVAASAPAARAADIGNPAAGRDIAARWCSGCHDITGAVPRLQEGPPAFPTIAGRTETTAAGLRAFLHTPHAQMPDLSLSRDETDHLIAFILSLKQR